MGPSAQAIATHSHLRWPDLRREWIRRQQARIARVDWESRLPCVLGPRKSRLSLFTRKQQKLLDKAREMEGVPDLSALLKGKLQLPSKKTSSDVVSESTNSEEAGASKGRDSIIVDEDIGAETPALSPKKKKKSKKAKRRVTDEAPGADLLLARLLRARKRRRRRKGRKGPEKGPLLPLITMICQEKDEKPLQKISSGQIQLKRSVEAVPLPIAEGTTPVDSAGRKSLSPGTPLEKRRKVAASEGGSRSEFAASERSAPDSATIRGARFPYEERGGGGGEFPDRVQFSYDEKTPLIFNPLRCAELTRQIRGGTRKMPQIGDLYFKDEYVDAAFTRARVLRVKFEELEGKLKSDRAAEKELAREKAQKDNLKESPEKDNPETDGILVREEGTENAGTEDSVLVSDTSSEEREDEEEEDDRAEKTSSPKPNEEETNSEIEKRSVSSIPTSDADLLVPTSAQVGGPIAFVTEDPVDPPAPSVLNGDDQDSAA
ncbi:LOW QUALITY PROTEIN: hypothetical protein HID58_047604 [Brassica napus]|uniref:Uncharacterized protein n=1 Tax=Brassica napus TaxID=3708 RepID=A0ABQ8AZP3_BRANA|nr:LOW QUALITY PROTEIN: hypothetical protein HID58_047604 [Brassica napus]